MRTDIERRQVAYDPGTGTLVVGGRSTVVTCRPGDNDCLLRTYLGLVAEQRDIVLGRGVHLRRDDIAVLAELLDLDDADLESHLRRILFLSESDAADLHRRLVRHKVAAAAVGVGLLAAAPAGVALSAAEEGAPARAASSLPAPAVVTLDLASPDALDRALVVEAAPSPVATGEPAPAPAAPAPAPEPDAEVGDSVRYERDPSFVPPEGVDIGAAMVLERELPTDG